MKKGSILAESLVREFAGITAVNKVDIDIPPGQIFGFLGPNGAGKSTLVKMLTTILSPSSGTAFVSSYNVAKEGQKVRKEIGVALQDVGLDPLMNGREMLILQAMLFGEVRSEAKKQADALLAMVGLYDVPSRKTIDKYSGGMKRRLDLALALVHNPSILFLDEPTTGLDPISRVAIWDEVRRLNRELGMTIFLTTQYLEEADRLADQVAIINDGSIVARGTPDQLKREMGEEIVEFSFDDDIEAGVAERIITGAAGRTRRVGGDLSCFVPDAASWIPKLMVLLADGGIIPSTVHSTKPSLDDVFLRATGSQKLEKAGSDQSEKGLRGAEIAG